ncbi:MAG TPA: PfkB family carbohydrate kinase, partial [Acidimicrobiales bacterium]|nr:PfkB family carbohydrate kinase [Acidimicrobiales bacterium]
GGERREVVQTAPSAIGRHEQDELHNMALAESIEAGLCVLAGTQAFDALGPEVYRRFVADLRAVDVSVVADLAGPILDACLASGIDVLKISDEELLADGRISSAGEVDILEAIEALHAAGATDVVVSRRENGLLARYDGMLVHAIAPEMAVADARGAGDSLTAALAVARARRLSCPDALRVAAAAAAVNVTRHGLASGSREAIEQLAPRVEIRQIAR